MICPRCKWPVGDGRNDHYCRTCRNAVNAAWKKRNRDKVNEYQRRRRESAREAYNKYFRDRRRRIMRAKYGIQVAV